MADSTPPFQPRSTLELDRLPPPAFPPGGARVLPGRRRDPGREEEGLGLPSEALISPDEPIRRPKDDLFPEGAFILPDDPMRPRLAGWEPEHLGEHNGEASGIGDPVPDSPSFSHSTSRGSPLLEGALSSVAMASILEELASHLREEDGISVSAEGEMTAFEAGMRGFLSAYLTRRSERL